MQNPLPPKLPAYALVIPNEGCLLFFFFLPREGRSSSTYPFAISYLGSERKGATLGRLGSGGGSSSFNEDWQPPCARAPRQLTGACKFDLQLGHRRRNGLEDVSSHARKSRGCLLLSSHYFSLPSPPTHISSTPPCNSRNQCRNLVMEEGTGITTEKLNGFDLERWGEERLRGKESEVFLQRPPPKNYFSFIVGLQRWREIGLRGALRYLPMQ